MFETLGPEGLDHLFMIRQNLGLEPHEIFLQGQVDKLFQHQRPQTQVPEAPAREDANLADMLGGMFAPMQGGVRDDPVGFQIHRHHGQHLLDGVAALRRRMEERLLGESTQVDQGTASGVKDPAKDQASTRLFQVETMSSQAPSPLTSIFPNRSNFTP